MTTLIHKYSADSRIKQIVLNPWFWAIFCSFFFSYPILKSVDRKLPLPNPVLYQLPEYQLINQYGKPFGSKDLQGKFYIANFFFSSCATVCPELMKKMQTIQHRVRGLGTNVALVSLSVDPEVDRPQRLLKEAQKYHANPYVWSFLTGEKAQVKSIIVNGFKLAMGDSPTRDSGSLYEMAHSGKLVLVDYQGNIRGFYQSDQAGINQLMIDLGLLANREIDSIKNS